MMVPTYVVILFGVGAGLFATAIALAWRKAHTSKAEGPVNKASTILATAGFVIAASSVLLGIIHQGVIR